MFTASFLFRSTLVFLAASPTVAQQIKDMPGTARGQYRPTGFTGKLTAYDLDEVVQRNKQKKRRGEAHAYTCFIVKEFSERYYPTATFHWHQSRNTFRHVGVREKRDNTVQEIFLSRTSLSDSLQWGFFHGELERTTTADRFAIIRDPKVKARIKSHMRDRKFIDDPMDVTDVFSYRTRSFTTESRSSNLQFPKEAFGEIRYGVSVGKKVYFFTAQGQATK